MYSRFIRVIAIIANYSVSSVNKVYVEFLRRVVKFFKIVSLQHKVLKEPLAFLTFTLLYSRCRVLKASVNAIVFNSFYSVLSSVFNV